MGVLWGFVGVRDRVLCFMGVRFLGLIMIWVWGSVSILAFGCPLPDPGQNGDSFGMVFDPRT